MGIVPFNKNSKKPFDLNAAMDSIWEAHPIHGSAISVPATSTNGLKAAEEEYINQLVETAFALKDIPYVPAQPQLNRECELIWRLQETFHSYTLIDKDSFPQYNSNGLTLATQGLELPKDGTVYHDNVHEWEMVVILSKRLREDLLSGLKVMADRGNQDAQLAFAGLCSFMAAHDRSATMIQATRNRYLDQSLEYYRKAKNNRNPPQDQSLLNFDYDGVIELTEQARTPAPAGHTKEI